MFITTRSIKFLLGGLLLCVAMAQVVPPAPDPNGYIIYDEGNCNLILSVTHGGSLRPDNNEVPDRTVCPGKFRGCKLANGDCDYNHNHGQADCQCGSESCDVRYKSDTATDDITLALQARILLLTGKKPHLIKSKLQRRKLDANREKNEATFGNATTLAAYNLYHAYIDYAKSQIDPTKDGLILDMHGQSHSEQWTEFGYVLPKWRITSDTYSSSARPSVCALIQRNCNSLSNSTCFRDLIRGNVSLGDRLNVAGYNSIPSDEFPLGGDSVYGYYTGGHVVKEHGSKACTSGLNVDAIQVEMPSSIRLFNETHADYVEKLADAVKGFMDDFYPGWLV